MAFTEILTLSLKYMERVPVGDQMVICFDKKSSNSVYRFVQRHKCVTGLDEVYGNRPGLPREACVTIDRAMVQVCQFYLATLWHLTALALLIQC